MDIAKFKELSRGCLEITDERSIHREAVSIPLDFSGEGEARLVDGKKLEIIGPEGDLEPFWARLRGQLDALDLSSVPTIDF